jgi:hypothetical protein
VGNGISLQIVHTGASKIFASSKNLLLNNILHIPDIKKNHVGNLRLSSDEGIAALHAAKFGRDLGLEKISINNGIQYINPKC